MTWISPDVPEPGVDAEKLLEGVSHRHPVKIEGHKLLIWLSICSMHFWHNPECHMCVCGHWYEYEEEWRNEGI